ncbi:MAG TPA: aerial mycelium formation protein [Actinomycetota bacterium]|nr:aerial mycelium formation protein [Actinomycetota bacterium]
MTGKRRIDRILSETYLEGLADRPMPEVRSMRNDCREEESVLSFERRMLHGRMDLLRAELARRADGKEGSLIDELAKILAGDERPEDRGGFPGPDPRPGVDHPKRRIEKLISDDTLANVGSMSPDEIEETLGLLSDAEREASQSRRQVQRVLDAINAEIARRYKSGEADPADALSS